MQTVIAIPDQTSEHALLRSVSGVPLLVRVMLTARRAGATSILVLWPAKLPIEIWKKCQSWLLRDGANGIVLVQPERFRPEQPLHWEGIAPMLQEKFLWLPWNWVTHKRALADLVSQTPVHSDWSIPALIEKSSVRGEQRVQAGPAPTADGVRVISPHRVGLAEHLVVARSGKPLDGIYSTFNRKLCRPAVRALSRTSITPNAVTIAGLFVAIASAYLFAQGYYAAYVGGAIAFFLSGLFDEMDGMLARVKFKESAFGTWFEGFVDNATYLLVFGGMTVGLYHQYGTREVMYGISLIVGVILSVIVVNVQRKRSTDPAHPNEYLGKVYTLLDKDSSNWISYAVRHIHVFLKKAVSIHYLLLFTVVGALPLFLRLAAFGSNLTWILGIYFSRRFFRAAYSRSATSSL